MREGISISLARRVRKQARFRCGYCLTSEILLGMPLEVEHLHPLALGEPTIEENLWLACRRCNAFKGARTKAHDPTTAESVAFFNPRTERWDEHFAWDEGGVKLLGKTPTGRATVAALRINNSEIVVARRQWVAVGWWPPRD